MNHQLPVGVATRLLAAAGGCALLTLAACATARPAGERAQKGVEVSDLNRAIDPCTDFFEFASGTWRAQNPNPAGKPKWSRRAQARDENRRRVTALVEEAAKKNDWPRGSAGQLLGDQYASCMDEAAADAAGLAPIAPLLAEIDGARDQAAVQRFIGRLHELAITAPFGSNGGMDFHAPRNFIANLVAGSLGLPDRESYAKAESRDQYRLHIAALLKLGGVAEAQASAAADEIFALEKRLADVSLDAAAAGDPASTDHKMTFAQLKELAPHFDWDVYFEQAKLPRGDLNVAEPKQLQQVDRELAETPVATWQGYLKFKLLDAAAPWLSRPFVDQSDKLQGLTREGKPRAARCLELTESLFADALGRAYVERYFPPAAKARARQIALNELAILKADVAAIQWMTPATKKTALEKLDTYNPQLGYPDKWKDYSSVSLRRDSLWANVAAGRRWGVDDNRAQVGKPTDLNLWQLPAYSPDAYLDLQLNEIVLPAGFLMPPAFDADATEAVNYGGVGVGLAHDMTHSIDPLGAENDVQGRPINWWTDADRATFAQRGQCVVDQYDGYFIEPGVHTDGKKVLSEAIGDQTGVSLAYRALQKSMETQPLPAVDGFTPAQQFFISLGQFRTENLTLEQQQKMVKSDTHAVSRYRVIGPLSNTPQFQEAFSCKPGAAMVRPAEQRCAAW